MVFCIQGCFVLGVFCIGGVLYWGCFVLGVFFIAVFVLGVFFIAVFVLGVLCIHGCIVYSMKYGKPVVNSLMAELEIS